MYSPKLFLRDYWVFGPLIVAVVAQAAIWRQLILYIHPTAERIFLHYNIIFGIDLVGEWWRAYFIPGVGLLMLVINLVIAWLVYGTDKLLARVLIFFLALLHIGLLLATYSLVGLNG